MGTPTGSVVREALLDAAYDAVVSSRWADARMVDVARAARVSRQTLYNEFGSKDGLATALALRETERFLAGTAAAMADCVDPVSGVRAAAAYTLRQAGDNPLLKAVLTDTAGELLPLLTTRADAVYRRAIGSVSARLLRQWPALPPDDVALTAEVGVRLTLSYLVSPAGTVDAMSAAVADVARRILRLEGEPPS